ncbi:MAG: hypothetical protein AAF541_14115 [Pseudomonadota bacterium]
MIVPPHRLKSKGVPGVASTLDTDKNPAKNVDNPFMTAVDNFEDNLTSADELAINAAVSIITTLGEKLIIFI